MASIWLAPTSPAKADFKPLTAINAQPDGFLARVYKSVLRGTVETGVREVAEQTGREKFLRALARGSTITYNTTTQQLDLQLGYLANGVVPRRPFHSLRWLVNERQELHPGGLQIAGPFPFVKTAVLDVVIEQGLDVECATTCAEDAKSAVMDLSSGEPARSLITTTPPLRILAGSRQPLTVAPPPCDWVLITSSESHTIAGVHLVSP